MFPLPSHVATWANWVAVADHKILTLLNPKLHQLVQFSHWNLAKHACINLLLKYCIQVSLHKETTTKKSWFMLRLRQNICYDDDPKHQRQQHQPPQPMRQMRNTTTNMGRQATTTTTRTMAASLIIVDQPGSTPGHILTIFHESTAQANGGFHRALSLLTLATSQGCQSRKAKTKGFCRFMLLFG